MNGVEEWEAMTSAERAARLYYYAALASPTWAKEIDPRLIPFGIALREAFDTVRRQDAEKKKNAIKEDHNVGYEDSNDDLSYGFPRSKLGRDYILWRLTRIDEKLDLLTEVAIRLQSRLEIIGLAANAKTPPSTTSLEGLLHLIEGNTPDRCGLNSLRRAGIKTVEDVLAKEPRQLLAIRGFGKNALANLEAQLESKGYSRED